MSEKDDGDDSGAGQGYAAGGSGSGCGYGTGYGGTGRADGDGGSPEGASPFSIYAPDEVVRAAQPRRNKSTRPKFRVVKDVILVRSLADGPEGYLDAIGNPQLPPKLRRRSLLGVLTCDPLLNIEAVAVLETVPIPEE